ncbi:MAG TPA: helix-turn-helix transcriptional regulator [Ktedonobacterales bacterium]|nr:helix-turn-helix transcriptional regulator [Ktedonobacterales bacterium]
MEEEEGSVRVILQYLKRWRRKRRMSQEMLHQQSGVSVNSISLLERGVRKANPATIGNLARALRIRPEELVEVDPYAEEAKKRGGASAR